MLVYLYAQLDLGYPRKPKDSLKHFECECLYGIIANMCEKVSFSWTVNAFDDADDAFGAALNTNPGYIHIQHVPTELFAHQGTFIDGGGVIFSLARQKKSFSYTNE